MDNEPHNESYHHGSHHESHQDSTPSPSDNEEKYGFKKFEELSSNSSNSMSNEEMLAKNFIETLNFGQEEAGLRNMLINTSLYFEDIDYDLENEVHYQSYESELQMTEIMSLIQRDLSEPYSIYTYRYFIHNWPQLCFLALHQDKIVGAIVCKNGLYKNNIKRGYIAMLAVNENYRRKRIGSNLVKKAIIAMQQMEADEIVLETEVTNKYALKLYENLGFVRAKRLFRYYLNGVDALRLKLWLRT